MTAHAAAGQVPPDYAHHPCALVAIGASLGGIAAFKQLLAALPADFPLPVVIVQHLPEAVEPLTAKILQSACPLPVVEPEIDEPMAAGRVYLAPPGYHLLVHRGGFELSTDAPVLHSRPSIDVFFESVASAYGREALGILLTGASEDGARGLLAIRRAGGLTLAQDPAEADASIMPAAALRLGAADRGHRLAELAQIIASLRPSPSPSPSPAQSAWTVPSVRPLPAATPGREVFPAAASADAELPRVLVVDDQPKNLLALTAVLDSPDWEIVTARSGEEALRRLLEQQSYALVLLDVHMPGMDGFEVARLLKQRPRHADLPLCFVTGTTRDARIVDRAYAAGVVDFLVKPVDPVLLRAKVTAFTRLWRTARQLAGANQTLRAQAAALAAARVEQQRVDSEQRLRTESLLQQQAALLELTRTASNAVGESYAAIARAAVRVLGVARVSVWQLSADRLGLVCVHLYRSGQVHDAASTALSQPACPRYLQTLASGRALASSAALHDARLQEVAAGYLRPYGVSSLLAVGRQRAGELLGALAFEHIGASREWSDEEQGFAQALADQLALAHAAAARQQAEQALRQSEARFKLLVDAAPNAVVAVDLDGRIQLANAAALQLFGYAREELVGHAIEMLVPERFRAVHPGHRGGFFASPGVRAMGAGRDLYGLRKDGTEVPIEIGLNPVDMPEGPVVLAAIIDITERKKHEAATRASLAEKELLLREIHHRVKNNLQIVSSLLQMRGRRIADAALRAAFTETEARVKAMALVHESLYREASLASIDFGHYLKNLAAQLLATLNAGGAVVSLETECASIRIPVDTAIPLGLIATELVTNALKHAYRDRATGRLRLVLAAAEPGRILLSVSDDGPGMPAGGPSSEGSLGLTLIRMLVSQVRGELTLTPGPGGGWHITLPLQDPPG